MPSLTTTTNPRKPMTPRYQVYTPSVHGDDIVFDGYFHTTRHGDPITRVTCYRPNGEPEMVLGVVKTTNLEFLSRAPSWASHKEASDMIWTMYQFDTDRIRALGIHPL